MKIAMLTTQNSACGIAEYSRHFIEEYENLGHEVLVLGNPDYFGVYWWGEGNHFNTKDIYKAVEDFKADVFHVQYQSSLYNANELNLLLQALGCAKDRPKLVATVHDSSRGKQDLGLFDNIIFHKKGVVTEDAGSIVKVSKMPFPILEIIPMVYSFGMGGRNDYKLIERVCTELHISFMHHDGREDVWLTELRLYTQMRLADAIVLWYNEVPGLIGASSSARTALSSHRPVITNGVGWFSDLDEDHYYRANNEQELKETLDRILDLSYIRENSYHSIAKSIINEVYGG